MVELTLISKYILKKRNCNFNVFGKEKYIKKTKYSYNFKDEKQNIYSSSRI